MKLVDVHCHLNHRDFAKDLPEVIERAKKAGVVKIICSGTGPPANREVLELSRKYSDIVGCTFGAYPLDALNIYSEAPDECGITRGGHFDLDAELEWIKKNKDSCVGIGEAGLDYAEIKDPEIIRKMKEIFQKIIEFCEKIKKPLVVHSRKAEDDCVQMIESSKLKSVVFHCFHGRKSLLKRINDGGWCCSIPPVIYRLQHFETVVQTLGINQILTETDAPWLGPVPRERNEPANVALTIKRIATIKGFTEEEVANNIFLNYQRVFT
ncbi:MAG: TatD family hydrolase [Candidatus Woesearchaeota archaeon]